MSQFVDLHGASGAAYRFRLAEPQALPATAGNFVFLVGETALCCGTARSLVKARAAWDRLAAAEEGARLYVRLNVASATRAAEHTDLVEALKPQSVIVEAE